MAKRKLMAALVGLCIGAFAFGCGDQVHQDTSSIDSSAKESPSAFFKPYWEKSAIGDMDAVRSLIVDPPDRFYLCRSISRKECDDKLSAIASDKAQKPGSVRRAEMKIPHDDSLVRTIIPKGIMNGAWRTYSVVKEEIVGEEARVRISVKGAGFTIDRDVLMSRTDGTWKVFEFADPGDYEMFATP